MNSLLHNPLTDLALVYFLALFAMAGLFGLIAGAVGIWLCDRTRDDDLPDFWSQLPDPYEVAYLRGGPTRVTRLAVFDLIEQGYLELSRTTRRFSLFTPRKRLRRNAAAPDLSRLTPVQRAAWNWVAVPRLPSEVLHRHVGLGNLIAPLCQVYVKPLQERRLLETAGRQMACKFVFWSMSIAIVSLSLYKLVTLVITGQNESFGLILLMGLGLISTAIICRRVRLSDLGSRYLESLILEFGDWDHLSKTGPSPNVADVQGTAAIRLLRMALFCHAGLRHVDEQQLQRDNETSRPGLVQS